MPKKERLFKLGGTQDAIQKIQRRIVAPSLTMGALTASVTNQIMGVSPIDGIFARLSLLVDGPEDFPPFTVQVLVGGVGQAFIVDKKSIEFKTALRLKRGDKISIDAQVPANVTLAYGCVLAMSRGECDEFSQEDV